MDAAERRKQMIQESKFLGGDMEHTHLVKGLDYALLQKVRSEIEQLEEEDDEQLEETADKAEKEAEKKKEGEEEIQFKTILGKNIFRYFFLILFKKNINMIHTNSCSLIELFSNRSPPIGMNTSYLVEWPILSN